MILDKSKMGNILGIISLFPVIVNIIVFYVTREPNADIYFMINLFSILSVVGIVLAVMSLVLSKRRISGLLALPANLIVLACAFLLLTAMGISEP